VLDLTADSVAITQAICDVPSVSGDETLLADLVVEALADAGHLDLIRDGDTVVARTNLGRERRVVIAGHLDTVPVNRNLPTRFETVDGERYLWGRGTVDMKGGVAVQLKLASELADPAYDITWMWYDHEEVSAELNGLGGRVTELDDGLRIEPVGLTGGPWRAYADHRMATTGAIIGLAVPGVVVDDIGSTSKTLPQFTKLWEQMLA